MADLAGADKYFADTLRAETWRSESGPVEMRQQAVNEAANMFSRLSFRRQLPPERLDNAIYEQAFYLLGERRDGNGAANAALNGIKSRSLGDASESYAEPKDIPGYINGLLFCPLALSWVSDYLLAGRARSGRIV